MANVAHSVIHVLFDVFDVLRQLLNLVDLSAAGLLWFASDFLAG